MRLQAFKKEFFYIRKAFWEYRKGGKYVWNRWVIAPKILDSSKSFQRRVNKESLSIHALTSHKDLLMLVWSLASFYAVANVYGRLYIHDDGSLTTKDKEIISALFPNSKIINSETFLSDYGMQISEFSVIAEFREIFRKDFVLLKKLIDPYFVSDADYRLILDSDLLWFRRPVELENLSNLSYMMRGKGGNGKLGYVFFRDRSRLPEELAAYNSGIVLYKKENFDLEKLSEFFLRVDHLDPRNRHFIEQAAYAYCLKNLKPLPVDTYHIKGPLSSATVVKHYTGPRRPLFYAEGVAKLKAALLHP